MKGVEMIQIYKDDTTTFEASVSLNGSSGGEVIARLILEVGGTKYMFDGTYINNKVVVPLPRLMDIEEASGYATLEVISDRAYFTPWESEVSLLYKKSVDVETVSVESKSSPEVTVVSVNLEQAPILEEKTLDDQFDEKTIFIPECSTRNIYTARSLIEKHNESDEILNEFSDAVTTWARDVFVDTTSKYAKIVMSELTKKLEK